MYNNGYSRSGSWVFRIISANVVIYLLQHIYGAATMNLLGLTPSSVIDKFYVWQIFTYMFLHDTSGLAHIFFNMYGVLLFGLPVEQLWGPRKFLGYYFFTGVGAGITILVINLLSQGNADTTTIGASGAVFGLLLAFGILFPDAELLIFFFIPMKAKFLVVLYGGLELFFQITSGGNSSVSHIGHLGGLFFGLLYFFIMKRRGIEFRAKKIRARLHSELTKRKEEIPAQAKSDGTDLLPILRKIKQHGIHSLTDDEFQYIKRMDIFLDGRSGLCVEDDFSMDDDYCRKCDDFQACVMREIRKYL